jgi:hypothetical protein
MLSPLAAYLGLNAWKSQRRRRLTGKWTAANKGFSPLPEVKRVWAVALAVGALGQLAGDLRDLRTEFAAAEVRLAPTKLRSAPPTGA